MHARPLPLLPLPEATVLLGHLPVALLEAIQYKRHRSLSLSTFQPTTLSFLYQTRPPPSTNSKSVTRRRENENKIITSNEASQQIQLVEDKRYIPRFMEPFAQPDDGSAAAVLHESPQKISAAPHCVPNPLPPGDRAGDEDDLDLDDDFEFTFEIQDPDASPAITADEIFSNGQIRPVYPVFNRALLLGAPAPAERVEKNAPVRGTLGRLLIEEREENSVSASSSSSSLGADDLDGIPPGTYCVWAPASPPRCRKSRSTGSSLRWRLHDLVVGRSKSDGKEKFVFLAASEDKKEKEEENSRGRGKAVTEAPAATAHRLYYGNGGQVSGSSGASRRSFLPYKPALVELFANVNGLKRTHHPF
ncbi:hypothetical protein Cni_G23250 [Canna indica]|uniref:Uncharacterized protein n=1 Tax=Canna indica TaxID=4628 RepID=A0AAQ3KTN2_9LILI|nr:hypothetical protein Cni_G23250 [Canna indica]